MQSKDYKTNTPHKKLSPTLKFTMNNKLHAWKLNASEYSYRKNSLFLLHAIQYVNTYDVLNNFIA